MSIELGHRQADTVDGYAITQGAISENGPGLRDDEAVAFEFRSGRDVRNHAEDLS